MVITVANWRLNDTKTMPASAPEEVTAYVRDWIERTYKAGKSYIDIADELDVSPTQINNIRDAKRGVGRKLETRFADLYHHGSVEELRQAAVAFCQVHVELAHDLYAHRAPALARLKGLLSPDVEQRVRSIRYRTDSQPSELHWIEVAVQEQAVSSREALRAKAVQPVEVPQMAAPGTPGSRRTRPKRPRLS